MCSKQAWHRQYRYKPAYTTWDSYCQPAHPEMILTPAADAVLGVMKGALCHKEDVSLLRTWNLLLSLSSPGTEGSWWSCKDWVGLRNKTTGLQETFPLKVVFSVDFGGEGYTGSTVFEILCSSSETGGREMFKKKKKNCQLCCLVVMSRSGVSGVTSMLMKSTSDCN